jgi:uncharacterized membrane protein
VRFWLVQAATLVALFLMCAAWSFATPISSGPDESGHIMKAAASVRGMWTGTPTNRAGIETFVLPGNVADVGEPMTCTAFHPERSAACAPSLNNATSDNVAVQTGVGSYNPLYYLLVGWPSLFLSGESAVYGMRLVSAFLSASLLTLTFWGASALTAGSRYPQAAALVAFTPMVYFLGGVINPNGLESAGVAAFVVLLWLVLQRPDSSRAALVGLAATVALVANLRATSPLYLLLATLAVFTAVGWPGAIRAFGRVRVLAAAIPALVVAALGAVWTLRVGLPAGFIPSKGRERDDPITAFFTTLDKSTDYGRELVGVFGWLDTQMPEWIYAVWTALVGVVVLSGLALARRKHLAAIIISLAALALVPALVQAPTVAEFGYIWQGRYSLPLFVTLLLVAGVAVAFSVDDSTAAVTEPGRAADAASRFRDSVHSRAARRSLVMVAVLVTTVQMAAFVLTLHRYVVGDDADLARMFDAPEWVPPGGIATPLAMFAVGAVLLATVLLLTDGARARMPRTPPVLR